MRKKYILTFVTEFVVLSCQILVFKLAALFLGKTGFAEYALAKRNLSVIVPVLLLGLGVGIPRYVAMARAQNSDSKNPESYLISAFSMIVLTVILFLLVAYLFADHMAFLLFGNQNYQFLILPWATTIAGICFHTLVYSYFRGYLKMGVANLLQLINIGLIPVLVFVIPNITVPDIFLALGLAWIITSGAVIFLIFKKNRLKGLGWSQLKTNSKQLLSYGIGRVPGDLGMLGFFSLPAILTAHFSGIEQAGLVAFAISILTLLGSVFYPVGLIMLPQVSNQLAKNDLASVQANLRKLLKISLGLTVLLVLLFELFAPLIIKIYLGKEFVEAAEIMRLVLIGAVPYVVYSIFKNASDALYVKPMNMKNVMIALAFFLVVAFVGGSFSYLLLALCLGLFILGGFTWYDVSRAFRAKEENKAGGGVLSRG